MGALLLTGCGGSTTVTFQTCDLDIVLDAAAAAPGDLVTAVGGPFLRDDRLDGDPVRDTLVLVDGVDALVVDIASVDADGTDLSEDCNLCFECREAAECSPCGRCDGRLLAGEDRRTCFGSNVAGKVTPGACDRCEQRLTFEVPTVEDGERPVSVLNRFGASPPVPLTVTAGTL